MLVIVMHNNDEYLEFLVNLAQERDISDVTTVHADNLGINLIGKNSDMILTKGSVINSYKKAFVASIDKEELAKKFVEEITENNFLDLLNIDDQGFVCLLGKENIFNRGIKK